MPVSRPVVVVLTLCVAILAAWGGANWLKRGAIAKPAFEFMPQPIGAPVSEFGQPWVTHLDLIDLDQDGLLDVLYCDAKKNTVRWIRQSPRGVFVERILAENIPAPAHVSAADLNGTGRLDVLVAGMGQVAPSNATIGSVVVLENLDNREFRKRVLIDGITRVTDVRAINLAGHADRRLDLVVGQFGYIQGEISWLENLGDWKFQRRVIHSHPGTIHTPVADFDGDGLPDFAALISQDAEEVRLFRQREPRQLEDRVLWRSTNQDWGSSGMSVADINQDGKPDLLVTNGDGLDFPGSDQRPWHGLQWLENLGEGNFRYHRLSDLPGCFGACAADLDGDGDIDILAVSAFSEWDKPDAVSMMAWINDGQNQFSTMPLAYKPIRLITAAVGDLDGNGVPVIVTGGFFPWTPFRDMSNITLWRRK